MFASPVPTHTTFGSDGATAIDPIEDSGTLMWVYEGLSELDPSCRSLLFALYFMTNVQQVSYYLGALVTQNIGAWARFMLPPVFLHFFLVAEKAASEDGCPGTDLVAVL